MCIVTVKDIDGLGVPEVIFYTEQMYQRATLNKRRYYDALFTIVQDPAAILAIMLALHQFTDEELTQFCCERAADDSYLRRVEWEARYGGNDESL